MRRITGLLVGLALATVLATPAAANPFPNQIDLPDGWQPEGITSDGTTLYVGSLKNGAIWRGTLQSGTGDVFIPGVAGLMAVGIDFDGEHDRLWVAGGSQQIRVYDATSGSLLQTYTFQSGFVNDIVVTPDAVYATDSNIQQLLVVPLGAGGALPAPGDAFTLPLTGDITYVANEFNANGIAWARGKLVIVQSITGLVFSVDPESGEATKVTLSDASGEYFAFNGDGIEVRGSTLAVVRNFDNLVATFKLDGRLTSGVLTDEIESDGFAIPTTATWAAGDLWAVNARFDIQMPPPDLPYWITKVPGL
jgi:hypothetical protein